MNLTSLFKDQKYLIIHADDAGLAHAENRATMAGLAYGLINSYSIMVPCPWFYDMATFALERPEYDYGIHLTLTCEWQRYKFGPVAPSNQVTSLTDQNGYFFPKRELLNTYGLVNEVRLELKSQIETALKLGLQPSHLDAHMFGVGSNKAFLEVYKELGKEYDLPVLLNNSLLEMTGLNPVKCLDESDFCVDELFIGHYEIFQLNRLNKYYLNVIDEMKPGLNILLLHPAYLTEEMRSITVNHPNFGAEWRQIDLDTFTSKEMKEKIGDNNIKLINWREVKAKINTLKVGK